MGPGPGKSGCGPQEGGGGLALTPQLPSRMPPRYGTQDTGQCPHSKGLGEHRQTTCRANSLTFMFFSRAFFFVSVYLLLHSSLYV